MTWKRVWFGLSRTRRAVVALCAGCIVFTVTSFYGSALLGLYLREFVRPMVPAIMGTTTHEAVRDSFSTTLSMMIATLLIAPFAGLLGAGVSRAVGRWRLLIPVIALGCQSAWTLAIASRQAQQPFPDEQVRAAALAFLTGFRLLGVVTLLAIIPAVLGAWLGMKLWPTPSCQTFEHEDQLPAE